MGANFRPNRSVISDMKPFRFWCQKVLPTVYDDSLSYYELLCKVVRYLNETVDNIELLNSNVNGLYDAYVALENYVNTYFEQDFPNLVDERLDEMAQDGTLTALIGAYVDPYFDAKSDELEQFMDNKTTQINNAISEQNATIETNTNTLNSAISSQNSAITNLENRMTAFITNHSGLNGETVLADLSASADRWYEVNSTVTLNDDVTNYKYIDFYVCNRGKNIAVQRFTVETVLNAQRGFYITQDYNGERSFGVTDNVAFLLHIGLNSAGNNRVLKMIDNNMYTTLYTPADEDTPAKVSRIHSNIQLGNEIYVYKIVGIKDVADSEVVDARVGYNGTIYQTLGDAIRSQINSLINVITGEIAMSYDATISSVTLDAQITSSQIRTLVLANKIPTLLLRDTNGTIRNFTFSSLYEVTVDGQEPGYLVDFVFSPRADGRDSECVVRIDKNGTVTWTTRNY